MSSTAQIFPVVGASVNLPNPLPTQDSSDGTPGSTAPATALQTGGVDPDGNLESFATDLTGRQIVVGPEANGVIVGGSPVLVAGYDGTYTRTLLTDSNGQLKVLVENNPSVQVSGTVSVSGTVTVEVAGIVGTPTVEVAGILGTSTVVVAGTSTVTVVGSIGNPAAGPTGSPVPSDADYVGFNSAGDLVGVSSTNPLPVTGTFAAPTGTQTVVVVGTSTVEVAGIIGTPTVEVAGILGTSTVTIAGSIAAVVTGTQTVTVTGGVIVHDTGTVTATIVGSIAAVVTGTQTVEVAGILGTPTVEVAGILGTSTVSIAGSIAAVVTGTQTVEVAGILGTPTVEVAGILGTSTVAVVGSIAAVVTGTQTVEVAGIVGTPTVEVAGILGTSTVTIAGTVTVAASGTQTVTVSGSIAAVVTGTQTVEVAGILGTSTVTVSGKIIGSADGPVVAGTAAASSQLVGSVIATSAVAGTVGQQVALQSDVDGILRVNPCGQTGSFKSYTASAMTTLSGVVVAATVPAGKKWIVNSSAVTLTTDTHTGTRVVQLYVQDAAGNILLIVNAGVNQGPNDSGFNYTIGPSIPLSTSFVAGTATIPCPSVALGPGGTVNAFIQGYSGTPTPTANIAGDLVSTVIAVEEYND
jgi:hypothetical protein